MNVNNELLEGNKEAAPKQIEKIEDIVEATDIEPVTGMTVLLVKPNDFYLYAMNDGVVRMQTLANYWKALIEKRELMEQVFEQVRPEGK